MSSHIYSNPHKYSRNNSLQYNFAMTVLSNITFDTNSRILDIGCGDGAITKEIASIVSDGCVIGTDISAQMIEFASKTYSLQDNLRFLQMDANKNIFREQFDIITSFNCLHWVKNQLDVLAGISKAAVPEAQVALLLSHKKSLYHLVLDALCSTPKWKHYFIDYINPRSFYDLSNYKQMVIRAGLEIINISEEEMFYIFESTEDFKDFFNAAGSQIKQIPDKLKNDFLDDFVNEFIKMANCEEEYIPVGFWCLQVIAKKPILKLSSEKLVDPSDHPHVPTL